MRYGITPWGRRFAWALEGYDRSGRLARGKNYADAGKVTELLVQGGHVSAKVAGSSRPSYDVAITFKPLNRLEREGLLRVISLVPPRGRAGKSQAALIGKLEAAGIDLIPRSWAEMGQACSCPDWRSGRSFGENYPCKHLAAVFYLLAEEIDQDPRLLLALRDVDLASAELPEAIRVTDPDSAYLPLAPGEAYPALEGSGKYVGLISALLPREGRFSGIDLTTVLIGMYHALIRGEPRDRGDLALAADSASREGRQYRSARYQVQSAQAGAVVLISFSSGALESLDASAAYALFLGFNDDEGGEDYRFLFHFFRFIRDLARNAAFVPAPELQGSILSVTWRPFSYAQDIKLAMTRYAKLAPPRLIPYDDRRDPGLRESIVSVLASTCLAALVREIAPSLSVESAELAEATALFFRGGSVDASKPDSRSLPRAIAAYLAPVSLDFPPCAFRFSVRERRTRKDKGGSSAIGEGRVFSLSLSYQPLGKDSASPTEPTPGRVALKNALHAPGGAAALRNAAILRVYLPELEILATKSRVVLEESRLASFLSEAGPILRRIRAEVVLPKSLSRALRPRSAIKVEVKGSRPLNTYLGLDALLSYDKGIAIGDRFLSAEEFERLVREKREIVAFRDGFVRLDPVEAARLLERAKSREALNPLELLRARFSGEAAFSADAEELAASLFRERDAPIPTSLRAKLRPYQERGYRWAYSNLRSGFGCALADDMGLGKTVQAIAIMLRLREEGLAEEGILVVAPAALLENWSRELERFAPSLDVKLYHGSKRSLREKAAVRLTTYATATRDAELLARVPFSLLVADEAHILKNAATKQARALRDLRSRYKLALSGTPVENKLEDMRSLFDLILPGYLGTAADFRRDYRAPIEGGRDAEAAERLKRITSPFLLRRLKTDPSIAPDLPEKIAIDEYATMTRGQAALYESVVRRGMEEALSAGPEHRLALILKLATSLKQVCDHPRVYDKESPARAELSGKALLLVELLGRMLDGREKVLVFSQYVECLDVLRPIIARRLGEDSLLYTGRMDQRRRTQAVDAFQGCSGGRVMLISLKAGGLGLNLTAATRVIHYDLWFNPAAESQATDRAFRIGQTKNVFVHRLITAGSFEEKIDAMLKSKRELAEMSVATGESWISRLGTEELRELFG
jgi:SNF2 family DNA or RNA helicase